MNCKVILRRPLFINNRIKPTWPQSFWRPGQHSIKNNDAPIPPAGEVEMRQHLGVRGLPRQESRGQRPLVRPA